MVQFSRDESGQVRVSSKRYKCALNDCRHEYDVTTNHYGAIYSKCPKCYWMGIVRRHCSTYIGETMQVLEVGGMKWGEVA